MNRILQRFAEVEKALASEVDKRMIVLENERIVFYTPEGSSAHGAYVCAIILGGWACLLLAGWFERRHSPDIPILVIWIFAILIVICLGGLIGSNWKCSRENGNFNQFKLFEIDTNREIIIVPSPKPFYVENEETVAIADIQCFYGWHEGGGEWSEDYLYAVDVKDQTTVLSEWFLWSDKYVQLMGFLCEKPAHHRNNRGEITELADFQQDWSS